MAKCPNCGTIFRARAANGEGTKVDPETALSELEISILRAMQAFTQYHAESVRQIRKRLWDAEIKADYHQVQAALSRLVGRGMVNMFPMYRPPLYSWRQNE